MPVVDRYGPLIRDPHRIVDLPDGFSYRVLSWTGDRMSDGLVVPGFPDGMGAFSAPDGHVVLIRNHELESKGAGRADFFRRLGPYGPTSQGLEHVDPAKVYDLGAVEGFPSIGGTTSLVYDPSTREKVAEFLSLAGTERNCAGGVTPWGTWITCEESTETASDEFLYDHGYPFEVRPTVTPELQTPKPYEHMGRFRREAVAVDPATGIVYQTEDKGDGLLYRFVPDVPGQLDRGGRMQALALAERGQADTRNWNEPERFPHRLPVPVRWVDLEDVRSPNDDLRHRGHADGAALFARAEGIWFGEGVCFFACTSGGREKMGQIFKLTPKTSGPEMLELFIESSDDNVMMSADNLTTAPWGDLIVCEDRGEQSHLRGITPDGLIYSLACNTLSGTEFAGACFAPNLSTLFVNIQKPGLTLAIDGRWRRS